MPFGHSSLSNPNWQCVGKFLVQYKLLWHHGFLGYPTTEDWGFTRSIFILSLHKGGKLGIVLKSTVTSHHLALLNESTRFQHQLNKNFVIDQKLAGCHHTRENLTASMVHDERCQQIRIRESIKSFPDKSLCLRRPTWIHLDSMETSQQRHGFNQINSILLLQKCKRVDIMFKSKVASHHLALLT